MKLKTTSSILLAILAMAVPANADNLLKNGDAEAGDTSGWIGFASTVATPHEGANAFVLNGGKDAGTTAFSEALIPVDPNARYELSGFFMSEEETANVYLGFDCYDADQRRITSVEVTPIPGTETELREDANKGDEVLKIKNGSAWVFDPEWTPPYGVVAFDVDASGACTDLPNRKLSPAGITAIRQVGGQWEVELAKPMGADYPAGTKVREQRALGAYRWLLAKGGIASKWVELKGKMSGVSTTGQEPGKFWPGTRFVKVAILNLNNEKDESPKVLVDDVVLRLAD
jgi:hypothetical protein